MVSLESGFWRGWKVRQGGLLIEIGVCRIGTMGHKEAGYNGQLFRYVTLPVFLRWSL